MTDEIIPEKWCDKYTGKLMKDPVTADDNYVYDRETITDYLKENGNRSPSTGKVISNNLRPNNEIKKEIQEGKKKIQVSIKLWSGKLFSIKLYNTDSVEDLEALLAKLDGRPPKSHMLNFQNKSLPINSSKLKDYGITNNSNIDVKMTYYGG